MLPEARSLRTRLILPLVITLGTLLVGTVGFWLLWRPYQATWLDAFFMTAITVTTIGYGEVYKLSELGRLWAVLVAFVGIGSLFYSFTVVMETMVSRRLLDPGGRRRMQLQINQLKGHIIVAGLGRVGRQAALELAEAKVAFVVLDPSEATRGFVETHRFLYIQGDAAKDEVLQQAGIGRASGLIVTTGNDASNLYIVLSARVLNPGLHIVSRAVDEDSVTKLLRAGANRAISPYAIGGRRLAHLILSPTVVDFFETVLKKGSESLNLEDILVPAGSAVIAKSLGNLLENCPEGISVLVVFRGTQALANPKLELILQENDRLFTLGTIDQLDHLEALVKV